jgi:hypothetical protein
MRLLVALRDSGAWGRWYIKNSLCGRCTLIVTNTVQMHELLLTPLKACSRFHSRFAKDNKKWTPMRRRTNAFQPTKGKGKSIRLDIFPISAFRFGRRFFFIFYFFPSPSSHYQSYFSCVCECGFNHPITFIFPFHSATVFIFNSDSETEVFTLLFIG